MNGEITQSLTLIKRLAAINRTIAASLDFEEALGRIAGSGLELVGAASCLVLLREGEEDLRICAAHGVDPATAEGFIGSMDESVFGKLQRDLGFSASQSIAASPIMSDRMVRGILVVIRDAPLNVEESSLVSALADQAAITLGNAHLHETLVSREARLRDEVERSRKLARELEALIQSVAHDLRAPLRTLTGCGDRLLDEYGDQFLAGRGREDLLRIASSARKTEALIDDLLAYSHLSRAEVNLEPVDLEDAVSEALADLETEVTTRGGLVRVESPLFKALAHRRTLVRILGGLFSPAVEFASPGERPLVEVRAEICGDWVRLSVLDHGIGFSTGIGLAIVQRGVERMGGRCGVESQGGQGNLFWIELRGA